MGYLSWFENHAKKHQKIVDKLQHLSDDEVIEYFKWENISKTDVDFCPLFKEGKKCHDMEELNCYLCACPNFRFDDSAPKYKSYCGIDSKDGAKFEHNGIVHQDCSLCHVPHYKAYIKKNFNRDWKKIMKDCYDS